MTLKKTLKMMLYAVLNIAAVMFLYYISYFIYEEFFKDRNIFSTIILIFILGYTALALYLKSAGDNREFLPKHQWYAIFIFVVFFVLFSIPSFIFLTKNFKSLSYAALFYSSIGGGFIGGMFSYFAAKVFLSKKVIIEEDSLQNSETDL